MSVAGFTTRELDVLALLVSGKTPVEIYKHFGFKRQRVYELLKGIYDKSGMREVGELSQWASEHGLNEVLGPETSAERPYPGKPIPRHRKIKLGRVRRSG